MSATIIEVENKESVHALFADDPIAHLELLDENRRGVDGIVTVFALETRAAKEDERLRRASPLERADGAAGADAADVANRALGSNYLGVRWGQKDLGLGSHAVLRATRVMELEPLLRGLPSDRGQFELCLPFWAAGAVGGVHHAEAIGAVAHYRVSEARLASTNVEKQCVVSTDFEVLRPMFPKIVEDLPAVYLPLAGKLVAVGVATHAQSGVSRLSVYTVEELRGRGFGRGVLTALARVSLERGLIPTVRADLGHERVVRLLESAGFWQHDAWLKMDVRIRKPGVLV